MTIEEKKKKLQELKEKHASISAKQNALKVFINSGYGALTNVYFRFFDIRLATSITVMGQMCIRGMSEYVESKIPIISNSYSDTDSNFFSCEKAIEERFKKDSMADLNKKTKFMVEFGRMVIGPHVNDYFTKLSTNLNSFQNTLKMENEVVGDKALFLGKKKYVVRILWKDGTFYVDSPKLKKTGIEIVRTSTPQRIRDLLEQTVNVFFENENRDDVIDYIERCRKDFKGWSFVDVAFPRGANNLEKYGSSVSRLAKKNSDLSSIGSSGFKPATPIQVRAAIVHNRLIDALGIGNKHRKIEEGDKVKFCYVKMPNPFMSNVIACPDGRMPTEIAGLFDIDHDTQFQKVFEAPLEKIFEAMHWNMNTGSTSIEDFFA